MVADGQHAFFSVGNRVYMRRMVGAYGTRSSTASRTDSLLACYSPHGSVIVSLTSLLLPSSVVVVFSAADCLYEWRVSHQEGGDVSCHHLESGGASAATLLGKCRDERVLSLRTCDDGNIILAFTSAASAYCLWLEDTTGEGPEDAASSSRPSLVWRVHRLSLPHAGLGVTLAADGFLDLVTNRCYVYCGTYAGAVSEWVCPVPSTEEESAAWSTVPGSEEGAAVTADLLSASASHGQQRAVVPTHRSACAVFSVKILVEEDDDEDELRFTLASCSDDRSVAVFRRTEDQDDDEEEESERRVTGRGQRKVRGEQWVLVWRKSGPEFSRSRIFDVCLLPVGHHSLVVVGVASEDGSVQAYCIEGEGRGIEGHHSAQLLCFMPRQHHHGALRVLAVSQPQTNSTVLLSGGFDGTIISHRLWHDSEPCLSQTLINAATPSQHNDSTHAAAHKRGAEKALQIRCLGVSPVDLTVVLCTRQSLFLVPAAGEKYEVAAIPSDAVPTAVTVVATGSSSVGAVAAAGGMALIGTESGCLLSVLLPSSSSHSAPSALLPVHAFPAFTAYRKCLFFSRCVEHEAQQQYVSVVSHHASGAVVLSSLVAENPSGWTIAPVVCGQLDASLHVSCSLAWRSLTSSQWYCAIGSQQGMLLVWRCGSTNCDGSSSWEPVSSTNIFHQDCRAGVAQITCVAPASSSHTHTELLLSSDRGECVTLCPEEGLTASSSCCVRPCPYPLSPLPSEVVSGVLYCSTEVIVAMSGTNVAVYRSSFSDSSPAGLWVRVATLRGVTAPRLYTALASPAGICVAHCSDGKSLVTHRIRGGMRRSAQPQQQEAMGVVTVLHGGLLTGQDFNSCCVVPPTAGDGSSPPYICCGCEDTSLVVLRRSRPADREASGMMTCSPSTAAVALRGPHHSNILGVCVADPYVVTVGGCASIAVWQHTAKGAEAEEATYAVGGAWRVVAVTTVSSSSTGPKRGRSFAEALPRYLAVCPVVAAEGMNDCTVTVASSDATVKGFGLTPKEDVAEGVEIRQLWSVQLDAFPRPVLCVAPMEAGGEEGREKLVAVAGDSGGRVFSVGWSGGVAQAYGVLQVEGCAVNAVASGSSSKDRGVEAAAITDSGTVHWLRYRDSCWGVVASISIGVTAGRGIAWSPLSFAGPIILALCEERVVKLSPQSSGSGPQLRVLAHQECNVRGVTCLSWLGPLDCERGDPSKCEVVVVGQGIEVLSL